ncbi:MAG: DUF5696 domain-containing protein [Kiritimatiellae bacterium]|jgi:hypothetical protein|nr:DUF5696 domain-containing protein [Kiritimatiellia bacterium]
MTRTTIFIALFLAPVLNLLSYNAIVTCYFTDGRKEIKEMPLQQNGSVHTFLWKMNDIPAGIKWIEVLPEFATAKTGEDGYFIMPNGELGTFHEKNGKRTGRNYMPMPIFGMKNPRATFVAIVTGLPYEYKLLTLARSGVYTMFPRFELMGRPAYDDIAIQYHMLTGDQADYSGMARVYRKYQLDRKACIPLKKRMKDNPELTYASKCMSIRIRQGWKPMPTPVEQQTRQNEPPMKVAVTFDRVGDILDEFKRQGIDRAELCLVGWNQKGHDGRFPQLFPVEEQLGGEKDLRKLIKKAQKMGFQIVCHNNSYDAYQIADTWDGEYIIKKPDGSLSTHAVYSGGRMYNICPQRAFERFAQKELRDIADLGFRGLHYNDVLTVVQPRACYDPRHPLNRNQSAVWVGKIMAEAQKDFGGSASEGGHDFCCGNLDYALYASIITPKEHPMVDRFVPFWQLVYHGIILSNPFPPTCNYTIKDKKTQLMLNEFGGRPFFYFYSNYRDNGHAWMGKEDITCENKKALRASVAKIKEGYDEFNTLAYLQTEFMDRHEPVAKDVYRTVYSNGAEMIFNYRSEPFVYKGKTIQPMKYILVH